MDYFFRLLLSFKNCFNLKQQASYPEETESGGEEEREEGKGLTKRGKEKKRREREGLFFHSSFLQPNLHIYLLLTTISFILSQY